MRGEGERIVVCPVEQYAAIIKSNLWSCTAVQHWLVVPTAIYINDHIIDNDNYRFINVAYHDDSSQSSTHSSPTNNKGFPFDKPLYINLKNKGISNQWQHLIVSQLVRR